jgi:peptidoglycan-N-acetylglucosamine deacetylase
VKSRKITGSPSPSPSPARKGIVALGLMFGCALAMAGCGSATSGAGGAPANVAASSGEQRPKIVATAVPLVPPSWSPESGNGVLYLTFDDGPGIYTPQILDILAENDAKATFFQIGKMVNTREVMEERIFAAGHAVGDHTWDHVDLTRLSQAGMTKQLNKTARNIGPRMGPCMRPPYGANNQQTRDVEVSLGMTPILWTKDTDDWRNQSQSSIEAVLRSAGPGDIVLMHDGGGNRAATVAALRVALPALKARGYKFESIPVCRTLTPAS